MSIKLRKYQQQIIESLRTSIVEKNKKIILCAPTGSGKTIMFTFMVSEHLKRGGSILVFTHRKELLNQAGSSFEKFDLKPDFIRAGEHPSLDGKLHVSMIETFSRRIEKYADFLSSRTMIIFDEAHLENFSKIFPYISENTIVIGATATPLRKGNQKSLSEFYTDLVQEIDTPELIDLGYLSRAKSYGVKIDLSKCKKIGDDYDTSQYYEDNKIYEGVIENYLRIADGKKTLVFTSNVESSKRLCGEFLDNGINARHIDANTKDRDDIFKWYDKTPGAVLCNCGIATTGFDQPDIECVILYRATTSLVLFLQMCGRGSRITDTKKEFSILDFGNNIARLGFWEKPREWSLIKKKKKDGIAPIKHCPGCGAILPTSIKECEYCGYIYPETEKEVKAKEIAMLQLLTPAQGMEKAKRSDIEMKVKLSKAKVISPFWVLHNLTNITEAREFIRLMGYKKGFEYMNKSKFKVFQNDRG
jgi:superfamily II DNA or RNA helicase